MPRSTFVEPLGADATARWRVDPHLDQASVSELPALRDGIAALGDANRPGSLGELTAVDSDIEALLAGVETPLLVARSAVAMPAALVLALAAYALLLTTRLLGEHRASEVSLLRARGLSRSQLSGQALREALMLALPAALVAPLLATVLLRAYDSVGPLAEAGLRVGVQPRASTWLVAATVAVGAVVVFVAPAGRSGATFVAGRGALGRQTRSTGLQRAGGDVLLAVAAGLAYWQLTTYGSPVLTDATGRLAVDPLLVLAPGLVLLAGAVLAMRLVPLASGAAERLAARGRGAPAALGAWQVSRRPGRHTGPALLLVMAIATAAFSVTYATAWSGSQRDRADFETGADLRLGDVTDPAAAQAVRELPGLTAAMRVRREPVVLGALDATVLALDAAAVAAVITVRGDLGEQPLAQLTGPLATPGTALPGLDIPPGTAALALPVQAGTGASPDPPVRIYAVLRDGVGVLHRVDLGDVVTNFEQRRLRVGLGAYVEPLRLVSVQVRHAGEFSPGRGLQPAALELRLGAPALDPGSAGTGGAGDPTWQIDVRGRDVELPEVTSVTPQPGGGVRAVLDPGCCQSVLFSASVGGSSAAARPTPRRRPLPALVSADLAATLGAADTFVLDTDDAAVQLRVAGELAAVPTVDPAQSAAVVVDLASLQTASYLQTREVPVAEEWWLAAGDTDRVAAAIAADRRLAGVAVADRGAYADQLRADPVGAGILGALVIGSLAAACFAVIGFAVSATVSARQRVGEFALLRAVGLGRRQLARMLALEQAVLIGVGLALGLLIGVWVARLVVPLVALTAQARRPFPPVLVPVPWAQLALLALVVVGVLLAVVAVLAVALSGRDRGAALRPGDDT